MMVSLEYEFYWDSLPFPLFLHSLSHQRGQTGNVSAQAFLHSFDDDKFSLNVRNSIISVESRRKCSEVRGTPVIRRIFTQPKRNDGHERVEDQNFQSRRMNHRDEQNEERVKC